MRRGGQSNETLRRGKEERKEMKEYKNFFFFKQKTAYEIKECDWSSDVCSSDLVGCTTCWGARFAGLACAT